MSPHRLFMFWTGISQAKTKEGTESVLGVQRWVLVGSQEEYMVNGDD